MPNPMRVPFKRMLMVVSGLWAGMFQSAIAQIILSDQQSRYVIGRQVSILEDRTHQYQTLADITASLVVQQFEQSQQEAPNRGFSTADYWVRFDLTNQSHAPQPWLLEIGFGNFSSIDIYVVSKRTGKTIHKQGGLSLGKQGREISYNTFVFYLPTQPGDEQTVYLRLCSNFGQAIFPLYIWRQETFVQSAQVSGLLWGIYYGFLLAVLLYHIVLWLFTREQNYLLLSLYLMAYALYESSRGYCVGLRFVWADNNWLVNHALSTFFTLTIATFLWLYSSVLSLERVAPRLQRILQGLIGLAVASWILTLFELPGVSQNLVITANGVLSGAYIIFVGAYAWYRGYRPARYYSAAALVVFVGGLVHSLNRAGVISGSDFFVHYTLNLGSVIELVFLSIGLADTVRIDRRQRFLQTKAEVEAAELRGLADERERMTSEMHDGVGSSLLTLRQSIRELRVNTNSSITLDQLERLTQEAYDEVSKIANNLLPIEFEQKGLELGLQELIDKLNQTGKTHFFLLMSGQEVRLNEAVQYQLYLVIVELINNIIKHAQATEASIRFAAAENILSVAIRDNGVGMGSLPGAKSSGRGWHNIRKRLARIGGQLQIDEKGKDGLSLFLQLLIS